MALRPQRDSSVTSTASISRAWASARTWARSRRSLRAPDPLASRLDLEDAHDLVARARGEGGEVALLALAGLIPRRDPAVERRAPRGPSVVAPSPVAPVVLFQLNPFRPAASKPLFALTPGS
jgi:hypothetical protein